ISGMSIGTLSGSVSAEEDTNPDSGTASNISVGSVTTSGTLSGGSLSGITVTGDMAGTIIAQGAGTISGMSIGTLSGSVSAGEDTNPDSGTASNISVGSVTTSGTLSGGSLSGITVTGDMAGTIIAQGAGTINGLHLGSLSGSGKAVQDADRGCGT